MNPFAIIRTSAPDRGAHRPDASSSAPGASRRRSRIALVAVGLAASLLTFACGSDDGGLPPVVSPSEAPQSVRMTYFGISNWTFQIGKLNIMMDGYMTRIPQNYFPGAVAGSRSRAPPIRSRVGGQGRHGADQRARRPINLILTGHSHFDHSFDTPYWARITGAR